MERTHGAGSGLIDGWWFPACAMILIFASDFKFRTRPPTDALAASVDVAILFELALYGGVGAFLVLTKRGLPRLGRCAHVPRPR
ncbi:MAG: hypothetical protein U1C73_11885, partial [Dietzia sp.]|nr:hypothetical protein [Dietzia sp.]